jgi:integrase
VGWIKAYTLPSGKRRYRVLWRDPAGKQHGKVFQRSAEARNFLREVDHSVGNGTYTDPARGRITVADLWRQFIDAPPRPLSPSTQALYKMQARVHILPYLGNYRINALEDLIRPWMATLEHNGVGIASVASAYRLLHTLLEIAVRERRIGYNPASPVAPPRPPSREMRYLTAREVNGIAAEVPARYSALVLLLAYSGLRIGEASALRVRNLDLMRRKVLVVEAASEPDGRRLVGETKTKQKRSVSFPAFVRDRLTDHLAEFGHPGPDSLVFTTEDGTPVGQHAFLRTFKRACVRGGVEPLRVHDLRHTAVALMIETRAHPKEIQEALGHASIKTTLDVYGHLFPSLQESVSDRLDALYYEALAEEAKPAAVMTLPTKRASQRSRTRGR